MRRIKVTKPFYSKIAPEGHGELLEYSEENEKSLHHFEEEHHTAWYAFEVPFTADMVFQIIPDSIKDDYDFILYRYSGTEFCDQLSAKEILPVRSCISRNDIKNGSKTGLSMDARDSLIHSGPGSSWSKFIPVKKGEKFVLVLDNCYDNGGAHTIIFKFLEDFTISGTVSTEDSIPPENALVTLENANTGEEIEMKEANPEDGTFNFDLKLDLATNYDLVFHSPGYFFKSIAIIPRRYENPDIKNINIELPKLEIERTFKVDGLNFEPNTPILTRASLPKIKHLLSFLKENPKIHIEIEGHTNCAGNLYGPTKNDQPLSEERAKVVYTYLRKRGISKKRLTRIGYGCQFMLFPKAESLEIQKKNMRVEVKITSLGE